MDNNISDKDKKDWENFLSNKETLPNKDLKIEKKKHLKIKSIDLHGYTLEKANIIIENFIIEWGRYKVNTLKYYTLSYYIHYD